MRDIREGFITRSFLRSVWALDYEAFKGSTEEDELFERLKRWADRTDLKETSAEPALLEEFFVKTWGYVQSGQSESDESFTLYPRFAVAGAGARGGVGEADAALGVFVEAGGNPVPQVLCEFKDIKSALDAPQRRKGNNRSPVQQGLDYLSHARRGLFGNEPVLPTWAIVTDMNEFRLYWADRGLRQFLRFTIRPTDLFQGVQLIAEGEESRFERFLFYRLFHAETLLVKGRSGRSPLAQLIAQQWVRERELENDFYTEYRAYREHLYQAMLEANPEGTPRFPGTRGQLVRLAQKILDRCIFVFYCEDMGRALGFPPQLLRDFLIHESSDSYFDPDATSIWQRLVSLFKAMNDGSAFGSHNLNEFNGGLFTDDPQLEALEIPNRLFCQQGQGQNEASLYTFPRTLLYLSASYNYASSWAEGLTRPPVVESEAPVGDAAKNDPNKSLGLYTLGRIFEQSITELEILEAEADGRTSLNKVTKRKRDGVYYTPEWVVDFIVAEAIGSRLNDLKAECGWPAPRSDELPNEEAIKAYEERLKDIKILDPACGSGAFLITSLRYLLDEWKAVQDLRRQVSGDFTTREGETDAIVRAILRDNLYGVDINPASVEITKLALWLHTARDDRPLSSLDNHIRDGNSLIGSDFYDGLAPYSAEERERINAFDWHDAFPSVFERGGFDVVVGNPPFVKLQHFLRVHADMARFLKKDVAGRKTYASTQTGNYDLFLPFIEKGISLLNDSGRLGYIAPSLWTMNEYGEGLREHVMDRRHLYGWIDFQSFQVFDEAITYTALQFYSKLPNDTIKVAFVPDGRLADDPWSGNDTTLTYDQLVFGDRWLMTTGADRHLIDRLYQTSVRLDDRSTTRNIYQGLITSADAIYHLKRLGPERYVCTPKGENAPPPYEVTIEDAIMKPLVSGAEAKRYIEPRTDTYLLFPYMVDENGVRLIAADIMSRDFPNAWAYLQSWEKDLRSRESGKFDDSEWYRFGRHQNLDKQEIEKLVVPRLVPTISCAVDRSGDVYLDNVDVGGVTAANGLSPYFLAGVLNAPAAGFAFRRISKPFRGEFRSANKQFIAPLPIPSTGEDDRITVIDAAEALQRLHTRRRDLLLDIKRRTQVLHFRNKPVTWLFPDLATTHELQDDAPTTLKGADRREWAKARYEQELGAHHALLGAYLSPGVDMDASFDGGELKFFVDGIPVVQQVFVDDAEGRFILAQWKLLASTFSVTAKTNGKKLANALRKIGETNNSAVVDQVITLQEALSDIEEEIDAAEASINAQIYALYGLSEEEIRRIKADR